jgi:predicted nucleotidyltransferase component of viral defense system
MTATLVGVRSLQCTRGAMVSEGVVPLRLLVQLFDIPELNDVLMFKGGTALSKVFKMIERFSEGIDHAIDYAPLGFVGDRDPRALPRRVGR